MAESRYVKTKLWDDEYVSERLDPIEKLLFIYFLTNHKCNIAGVYETTLKKIANDTGIDRDMVLKILTRFDYDKKITFLNGYIIIHNFLKNQELSKNMKLGVIKILKKLPAEIWESFRMVPKGCEWFKPTTKQYELEYELEKELEYELEGECKGEGDFGKMQLRKILKKL